MFSMPPHSSMSRPGSSGGVRAQCARIADVTPASAGLSTRRGPPTTPQFHLRRKQGGVMAGGRVESSGGGALERCEAAEKGRVSEDQESAAC